MTRPVRLFCFTLSRDLCKDVEDVLNWPLHKIAEYMAFYKTENTEWRKQYKEDNMTPEDRAHQVLKMLGG